MTRDELIALLAGLYMQTQRLSAVDAIALARDNVRLISEAWVETYARKPECVRVTSLPPTLPRVPKVPR